MKLAFSLAEPKGIFHLGENAELFSADVSVLCCHFYLSSILLRSRWLGLWALKFPYLLLIMGGLPVEEVSLPSHSCPAVPTLTILQALSPGPHSLLKFTCALSSGLSSASELNSVIVWTVWQWIMYTIALWHLLYYIIIKFIWFNFSGVKQFLILFCGRDQTLYNLWILLGTYQILSQ